MSLTADDEEILQILKAERIITRNNFSRISRYRVATWEQITDEADVRDLTSPVSFDSVGVAETLFADSYSARVQNPTITFNH